MKSSPSIRKRRKSSPARRPQNNLSAAAPTEPLQKPRGTSEPPATWTSGGSSDLESGAVYKVLTRESGFDSRMLLEGGRIESRRPGEAEWHFLEARLPPVHSINTGLALNCAGRLQSIRANICSRAAKNC